MIKTYTLPELEQCKEHHQVTPNGVAFDWWLVSREGAGFCLFREERQTDEDIEEAKAYLRRDRDVVGEIAVAIPRFEWMIGCASERVSHPQAWPDDGCVLWDHQECKAVVKVLNPYGQAFCLEKLPETPFTELERWFNSLTNVELASEGMPTTKGVGR